MLNNNVTSLSPTFEYNNVPVVIAVNNLFAPYAGVFIQSLLDHASEDNNYDIIIFERDISEENKHLLSGLVTKHTNVSIRFYDPSPLFTSMDYIDEKHRFPLEVYYRIIAPHILNYSGKIITADVDTLLKTDIARLLDEDLEGCSVGGVRNVVLNGMYLCDFEWFPNNIKVRDYVHNILKFSIDDLKNYVYAGPLLFDRDKYVRELDIKTILSAAQQGGYRYEELDILNIMLKGRIKALDFAWNAVIPPNRNMAKFIEAGSKLYDGACERGYDNPYLLHWSSRPKPWVCPDVPFGSVWWQTALRTPFVGHIIARMIDEMEKRRTYFRNRYGKEVDTWDPTPEGTD